MSALDLEQTARVSFLMQLVRMMMRERAIETGKTPEEILAYGETVRRFFEASAAHPQTEMYLNAQVSAFFDVLANEVRQIRESR